MESTEVEKAKKKASKDVSEVKEKKKKEKKSKEISAVEGQVKNGSTVEEKKSTKQKKEVNNEAKPDKKEKKEKKSTKDITNSDELVTGKDSKPPKRKRDTKDDSSKTKKKSKKTPSSTLPEELEIDISAPNPPSKKALRLQKKGKPIPKLPSTSLPPTTVVAVAATNTDTTHPDRQKLVKEIPRAQWSVWIGNLSYKSDVKSLRGWLVRGDKRVTDKDITRINLPLNADGQSKGFAYVDFLAQEAMEMVIGRSEENFDGRNLLIKNAKSFDGRPAERQQRYQVKNMPATVERMQVESGETVSGKEAVAEEPKEEEGLKKEKRKRTGEEKVKKAKKVKET